MLKTPKGLRLHIGIYGRRNVGKSSLLNALVGQTISIVSDVKGTTTDPVEKPMELLPLGPVVFIDTAGIDDIGSLGKLRIKKTQQIIEKTDLALLVTESNIWTEFEEKLLFEFKRFKIPTIIVVNKVDLFMPSESFLNKLKEKNKLVICVSAEKRININELKTLMIKNAPEEYINSPTIIGDLVKPGGIAILVVPIDLEAPKGRLILPQVQTIRDLLDNDACALVVKERELAFVFDKLNVNPDIVVTDSQAFLKVSADTPPDILMTSFSILFARFKGDLIEQVKGALALEKVKEGDKILICEACTHHNIADDIGTVKIPRWIRQYLGCDVKFDHYQGPDFPENLKEYKLIIHCGACVWNRRQMLTRIMKAKEAGVPITNYGLIIAYTLGIFERALKPFPFAYTVYKELKNELK